MLTLGILGLVLGCLPVAIPAWVMARRDLKAMDNGLVDPTGRGLTLAGKVLGIVATFLSTLVTTQALVAAFGILLVARNLKTTYTSNPDEPGVRQAATEYPMSSYYYSPSTPDREWQEIQDASGEWVKDGPARRWSKDHQFKLEEGSYRAGKREGEWTFRNEDGSIDLAQSGIYEDDVRVQAAASPSGDYPDSEQSIK